MDMPDYCYPEECVWKRDSIIIDVIDVKTASEAEKDLDGSLPVLHPDSWNERLLIPTKEMPDPSSPPEYLQESRLNSARLKILAGL